MTLYLALEVSDELLKIAKDIPELLTGCNDVSIDGGYNYIDSPKKLLGTESKKNAGCTTISAMSMS